MDPSDNQVKTRDAEELNTQKRASLLGLNYTDARTMAQTAPLIKTVLTLDEMRRDHIIPLSDGQGYQPLVFAIAITTPQTILRKLRDRYSDKVVQFLMISDSGFREIMLRHDPPKKTVYEDIVIAKEGDSETLERVSQIFEGVLPDYVLDYLIGQADRLNASDIHLETQQSYVRIRMRLDGTLHPVANLTHNKYRIIFGAIAERANISTASPDAQTGHMAKGVNRTDGSFRQVNMRIETVPTIYGQDVVLRLFNFDASLLQISNLGLSPDQHNRIDEIVQHPNGLVMMVGPTGSGKSTTLYSIINALNTTARKIITLEDPVELSIPGITQIPVNTQLGDSFAEKLRAVLRLDPDIAMVGEIRDVDTARTAVQAAITGHLVLTTFHASTASTAFSRIIDMIGQNPIFASAVRLVVAQRLVRKLDPTTKIAYKPDAATVKWVKSILQDLPAGTVKPDVDNLTLYKPGISPTSPFGYKGRMVILEQLVVSGDVQGFLRGDIKDFNPDAVEKVARKQGMVTLLQDGVLKACEGLTTLEEVIRVV